MRDTSRAVAFKEYARRTLTVRRAIPYVLLGCGLAAVGFACAVNDLTWKAVCIGVASTALAAGLVDWSAVRESRRRDQAILDIAGARVGRIHQQLLSIVESLFGVGGEAADRSRKLRELQPLSYKPDDPAPVFPPRTKAVWIAQCLAEIDEALTVALSLGVQTAEAARFVRVDTALRSRPLVTLRNVSAFPFDSGIEIVAREAADALDSVQEQLRFFANRNRPGWKYGQL
jgi:hypothetical protein